MRFVSILLVFLSLTSIAQSEYPEMDQVKKIANECLVLNKHSANADLKLSSESAMSMLETLKGEEIRFMGLQDGITVVYQMEAAKPVILSIEGKGFFMSSDIRSPKDCVFEESSTK